MAVPNSVDPTACQAELTFAAMVLNLGKLCRLDPARRSAALTT
ncbi:hypothetical protein OG884_34125 [Streptosporangium sp. NBC_01755]|nr:MULTISPECIES: hypothetical protein [unclassified Streptosporangium]WSA28766.1 hypothetical protein OIE13_13335 [Streptosporangium sp. NBC_01810]WSC99781.1 hypothetical protein OG884_34125 [Streptosporangium sp. NBC_01755]